MRRLWKWLKRLVVLAILALIAFLVWGPAYVEKSRNPVTPHDPYPVSEQARALHEDLVIGDWHADPLLWNRDLSKRGTHGQVDIPRLIEGNVAIQVFTTVTKSPAGLNVEENSSEAFDNVTALALAQLWPPRTWNSLLQRALYQAEKLQRVEEEIPDRFRIIRDREDLETLLADRAAGKQVVGGILGIEGAHPLEGNLANLDRLEAAGHRVISLQHFFDNALGGSLHGQGGHGLTDYGRAVVNDVARRGMVLDVAHSSEKVARDVLAMTDMPIIVSHTGIRSHCDTQRNFPDDLMREIAATGGVIGIGYWPEVACGNIAPAGIAQMIKTAIEVVGEDHVSLGSDFDGSVETAFDTSELAALTQALMDADLTEEQIRKVMGENMLRVLRARLN